MNRKKIIALGALIALTAMQCHGAASEKIGHNSTSQDKKSSKPLSFLQNAIAGAAAGTAEAAFPGQPLSYITNMRIQGGQIIPQNMYKGFGIMVAGDVPLVAIQNAVYTQAIQSTEKWQDRNPSIAQKTAVALFAGITGAVVATPQEAIALHQQNNGTTARQAAMKLKLNAYRGFMPTAIRDGLFTIGYKVATPIAQDMAQSTMGNNPVSSTVGGIAAGIGTSLASQPFAVVKTLMQSDPDKKKYPTMTATAYQICTKNGMRGFFKGSVERGTRVAIAVPLYAYYTDLFTEKIRDLENSK